MDVLVNLMRGIFSQGIHIPNYILVHFMNVTILFVNCTSIKLKKNTIKGGVMIPRAGKNLALLLSSFSTLLCLLLTQCPLS